MHIMPLCFNYINDVHSTNLTVYSLIASFQVRVDLGLPNHKKRAAIAKTVDDLVDQFRPAM